METSRARWRRQAPGTAAVSGRCAHLTLSDSRIGDVAVIAVQGELDLASGEALQEHMDELRNAGTKRVILDLSGLEFMDSCGLSVLIRHYNRWGDRDESFALVAPQPMVSKVLRITGLMGRFPVFPTVESATG